MAVCLLVHSWGCSQAKSIVRINIVSNTFNGFGDVFDEYTPRAAPAAAHGTTCDQINQQKSAAGLGLGRL
jgi:hypothetical protein